MNLFENENYYNKDYYDKLPYDRQKELFLKIRSQVPNVSDDIRYNYDKFKAAILNRIEQICAYACSGHIPSQDYMGYIYKRGFSDFFPVNYKRALEWNLLAATNGSKLAPQKMRAFMEPAIDMIMMSSFWPKIIKFNDLNLQNYFWFLSQYVSEILVADLSLNPVDMAKKELVEEDTNERRVRIFYDRYRDSSVEKAIEKLSSQLPDGMPDPDDLGDGAMEDLLKNEDGSDPNGFDALDIEDI